VNQFTKAENSCGKACLNGGKYPVARPHDAVARSDRLSWYLQ
jgi:hypothetical protein